MSDKKKDPIAAVGEATPYGKRFSFVTSMEKARKYESLGDEVIWVTNTPSLLNILRDRSEFGGSNVIERRRDKDGHDDAGCYSDRGRISAAFEFNAPVCPRLLDAKAMALTCGKAILHHISKQQKWECDGTVAQELRKSQSKDEIRYQDLNVDWQEHGFNHTLYFIRHYDKQKANKAKKTSKASGIRRGIVDFYDLREVFTILMNIANVQFPWFCNWQYPSTRKDLYGAIPLLVANLGEFGKDRFMENGDNGGTPYWKVIMRFRQFRHGLLKSEGTVRSKTVREWETDIGYVNKKIKVSTDDEAKNARAFAVWLKQEILNCIQFLRAKYAGQPAKKGKKGWRWRRVEGTRVKEYEYGQVP